MKTKKTYQVVVTLNAHPEQMHELEERIKRAVGAKKVEWATPHDDRVTILDTYEQCILIEALLRYVALLGVELAEQIEDTEDRKAKDTQEWRDRANALLTRIRDGVERFELERSAQVAEAKAGWDPNP